MTTFFKKNILEVVSTVYTAFTSSDGTVSFTKVPFGFYNITVNYTLNSGLYEEIVYDGRNNPADEVEFKRWLTPSTAGAFIGMSLFSVLLLIAAFFIYKRRQSKNE